MFSDREEKILKAMGKSKTTLDEITEKVFENDENAPLDKKITISNSVIRIMRKTVHYKLPWRIVKERSMGRMYLQRVSTKC